MLPCPVTSGGKLASKIPALVTATRPPGSAVSAIGFGSDVIAKNGLAGATVVVGPESSIAKKSSVPGFQIGLAPGCLMFDVATTRRLPMRSAALVKFVMKLAIGTPAPLLGYVVKAPAISWRVGTELRLTPE